MKRLQRWLYRKYLEFKYRGQPDNVCCCGGYFGHGICEGGFNCCRSMKEYTIDSAVDKL